MSNTIAVEKQTIKYRDGVENVLNIFQSTQPDAPLILCMPAMGIRASYYNLFAERLAKKGKTVVLSDYRGHGEYAIRPSRKVDFGYYHLIEDIKTNLEWIKTRYPNNKVFMLGHSLCGQLGGLCAAQYPGLIDGLIMITSCSVYYKGWEGRGSMGVWLVSKFFHPISKMRGFFPGNTIGFGGKEARTVMKDWGYNGLTGNYRITGTTNDYDAAMKKSDFPILAVSIKGDNYAPQKAVDLLLNKFNETIEKTHLHISKEDAGMKSLNHFNWTKEPDYMVGIVDNWIGEH